MSKIHEKIKELDLSQPVALNQLIINGSFEHSKTQVQKKLGVLLEVKNVNELHAKLQYLYLIINTRRTELVELLNKKKTLQKYNTVELVCDHFSKLLAIEFDTVSWQKLSLKVKRLIAVLSNKYESNKGVLYEMNRRSNFIGSSRLEGINLTSQSNSFSMEDVINKYKVS